MRNMKKLLLLFALCMVYTSQAQVKVKLNGKPIAENATIKTEDIKKLEVSFDKPKKLSYYGLGRLIFGVGLTANDEYLEEYQIKKNGTNAVEAFLQDVNTDLVVVNADSNERDFANRSYGQNLLQLLKENTAEMVTVKIDLMFFDKVGYEKYGDPVKLLKTFVFTIDNKANAAAYSKVVADRKAQQAQAQAQRDQENAQRNQANDQAKKDADKKATAKQAGGMLIRGLLGK
jgi:hypothetical protein